MQLHRFYCNPIVDPTIELAGTEAHHLISVLRLREGDDVELFDGEGTVAIAKICEIVKRKAILRIVNTQRYPVRTTGRIIIAPGICKGQRFDWLIEKCTELRTDRIMPVIFERGVKQAANPKVIERWKNLIISAAKQSRRRFLTRIDAPLPLCDVLEILKRDYPKIQFVVGSLAPDAAPLTSHMFGETDIAAFVGPEGGFTDDELDCLKKKGAHFVRLTGTVLRTETAALAFASVLVALRDLQ
jgi:16S rRNA (uracil1498-N3)-methyltransferase